MLKEFKEFALRGNVVDMAIGIVIGTAFGQIVNSLVNDVIMPPIGLVLGGVDFSEFYITLSGDTYASLAAAKQAGAATINVGIFLTTVVHFVVIALAAFLIVRSMNRIARRREVGAEPLAPTTRDCPRCFSTIPLKATRCAYCTSDVQPASSGDGS